MASITTHFISTTSSPTNGTLWLAFDGVNMWAVNNGAADSGPNYSLALSKVDITALTYTSHPGPALALALCYDSTTNIWVTSQTSSVDKVRTSDASILGNFATGNRPLFPLAVGASIWIANQFDGTLTQLKISDGSTQGTFTLTSTGELGQIAFDSINLWVIDSFLNLVYKVSTAGTVIASYAAGGAGFGITFAGGFIWIVNYSANTLTKMSLAGAIVATIATGLQPTAIKFDGTYLWIANSGGVPSIQIFDLSGALIITSTAGVLPQPVFSMEYDGARMWVMPNQYDGPTIYTLTVAPAPAVVNLLSINEKTLAVYSLPFPMSDCEDECHYPLI